jgi:hypothetical protein
MEELAETATPRKNEPTGLWESDEDIVAKMIKNEPKAAPYAAVLLAGVEAGRKHRDDVKAGRIKPRRNRIVRVLRPAPGQTPRPAPRQARGGSRAPRRAHAPKTTKTTASGDSDGPAPPSEPPRSAGQWVGAVTITSQSCFEHTGLKPCAWSRQLVTLGVPHGRLNRRTLVCLGRDWEQAIARLIGRKERIEVEPQETWLETAKAQLRAGVRR